MITIERASKEAVRYACRYFHYAGHCPSGDILGYSIFNDGTWCGVVTFSHGSNINIGKPYGLKQGEVCELTRVALNGKQAVTSQVVGMCLKRLKKDAPLLRLVVSYADADMKHFGTIYQATNWLYVGTNMQNVKDGSWIIHGERVHGRRISNYVRSHGGLKGLSRAEFIRKFYDPQAIEYVTKGKRKYLMPLDGRIRKQLLPLVKPYPKDAAKVTYRESHPEQYEKRASNHCK